MRLILSSSLFYQFVSNEKVRMELNDDVLSVERLDGIVMNSSTMLRTCYMTKAGQLRHLHI